MVGRVINVFMMVCSDFLVLKLKYLRQNFNGIFNIRLIVIEYLEILMVVEIVE